MLGENSELLEVFRNDHIRLKEFAFTPIDLISEDTCRSISVVLLKLLLDKKPVLGSISQIAGLKLYFCDFQRSNSSQVIPYADLDEEYKKSLSFLVEGSSIESLNILNKDAFFKRSLGVINMVTMTPKSLIKLYANKLGGKHLDLSFTEDEKTNGFETFAGARSDMAFNIMELIAFHAKNPVKIGLRETCRSVYITSAALMGKLVRTHGMKIPQNYLDCLSEVNEKINQMQVKHPEDGTIGKCYFSDEIASAIIDSKKIN